MSEVVERHDDGSQTVRVYDDDGRLVEKRNVPACIKGQRVRGGGLWRTSQNWAKQREARERASGHR